MARKKLDTLTEQMYYLLLALHEPGHGYAIMERARGTPWNRSISASAVRWRTGRPSSGRRIPHETDQARTVHLFPL